VFLLFFIFLLFIGWQPSFLELYHPRLSCLAFTLATYVKLIWSLATLCQTCTFFTRTHNVYVTLFFSIVVSVFAVHLNLPCRSTFSVLSWVYLPPADCCFSCSAPCRSLCYSHRCASALQERCDACRLFS